MADTPSDEYFCLTCGRFSHTSYEVVRNHHEQCRNKCIWCCLACQTEFDNYWEAEQHVYAHWRDIELENQESKAREMQARANALLSRPAVDQAAHPNPQQHSHHHFQPAPPPGPH